MEYKATYDLLETLIVKQDNVGSEVFEPRQL